MKTPYSGMLIYISPPNPQNMKIAVLVNDLTKKNHELLDWVWQRLVWQKNSFFEKVTQWKHWWNFSQISFYVKSINKLKNLPIWWFSELRILILVNFQDFLCWTFNAIFRIVKMAFSSILNPRNWFHVNIWIMDKFRHFTK